ncbi:FAD-dependent monooxygenase [Streptomyces caniscabiei]|uniref:FAD-dependent monooxygenase n=1 Tax=Streptomyces caniscabiei TaxID=2746961 RepID=UPI001F014DE1|nr:FAD-dependent monooxygenase [Streptomyces caniscabiei]
MPAFDERSQAVEEGLEAEFTFDLVVGADGLHSTVRRLAFGPEEQFAHHLGSYLSVFSADNFLALDNWQLRLRDGDAGFGIMPVRGNTELRIAFGFESAPLAHDLRDGGGLRQLVVDKLASLRWEGARLAEAARKAPDFYCDAMAQIRMNAWSRGRVTLLGDAGYCPSPLSGQGTSLALVGAHVLADCLAQADGDHRHRLCPLRAAHAPLRRPQPGPGHRESRRTRLGGIRRTCQERALTGQLTPRPRGHRGSSILLPS